ncbi:MAG TPA: methyltransferase domain-containing protein [Thermoanaerobaculia bacterium]|nr:methyltransferase domain-containing protein [Thermoanaerobaculia bacterium]
MFDRSLKKRQKVDHLRKLVGDIGGRRCLLITNGDNTGAMNVRFRELGGEWTWVENESDHLNEMEELLGETVRRGSPSSIPAEDASQDAVISIDVHEHLEDCRPFNQELFRVVRPGGLVVVSTPNGNPRKPVTMLKNLIGMTKQHYGHQVIGYTIVEHEAMLREVGLEPIRSGSYSRFFTETIELAINFAYVKVLGRKAGAKAGTIAPTSNAQMRSVGAQYRLYTLAFPVLHALSRLDRLLSFTTGYAVSVAAQRPE